MRRLAITAAVILLPVTALSAAQANPRPTCQLVRDVAGDADASGTGQPLAPVKSTDIVSADIASNGSYVTAALRVVDLYARSGEPGNLVGYALDFTIHRSRFSLQAVESTTRGQDFSLWRQTGGDRDRPTWGFVGYASGEFNDDESAVYVTSPLTKLGITRERGLTASGFRALTVQGFDASVAGGFSRTDVATGESTYRLGTPSCSRVPVNPCRDPRGSGIPASDPCPGGG